MKVSGDIGTYWNMHPLGREICLNCPYEECEETEGSVGCAWIQLAKREDGGLMAKNRISAAESEARFEMIAGAIRQKPVSVMDLSRQLGIPREAIRWHIRAGRLITEKRNNIMVITGVKVNV